MIQKTDNETQPQSDSPSTALRCVPLVWYPMTNESDTPKLETFDDVPGMRVAAFSMSIPSWICCGRVNNNGRATSICGRQCRHSALPQTSLMLLAPSRLLYLHNQYVTLTIDNYLYGCPLLNGLTVPHELGKYVGKALGRRYVAFRHDPQNNQSIERCEHYDNVRIPDG